MNKEINNINYISRGLFKNEIDYNNNNNNTNNSFNNINNRYNNYNNSFSQVRHINNNNSNNYINRNYHNTNNSNYSNFKRPNNSFINNTLSNEVINEDDENNYIEKAHNEINYNNINNKFYDNNNNNIILSDTNANYSGGFNNNERHFKSSNKNLNNISNNNNNHYPSNSRASNKTNNINNKFNNNNNTINHNAITNSLFSQQGYSTKYNNRIEDETIGAEISRITLKNNNTIQDSTLEYNIMQNTGHINRFESISNKNSKKNIINTINYNNINNNKQNYSNNQCTFTLKFNTNFERSNSFTLKPKNRYAESFIDNTQDLARFTSERNDIIINYNFNNNNNNYKATESIIYDEDYEDHITYGNCRNFKDKNNVNNELANYSYTNPDYSLNKSNVSVNNNKLKINSNIKENKDTFKDTFCVNNNIYNKNNNLNISIASKSIRKDTKEITESLLSQEVYKNRTGNYNSINNSFISNTNNNNSNCNRNSNNVSKINNNNDNLEIKYKNNPNHLELYMFLNNISLAKYTDNFINNGFDDLSLMLEQMKKVSKDPLTDKQLSDIGITLPGHRARILIKFEDKNHNFDFDLPNGLYYHLTEEFANTSEALYDQHIKYIENWLSQLKLSSLITNFVKAGYYSLELLLIQMITRNQINDRMLEKEIKIDKMGYRVRILNKLKQGKIIKTIINI